jgi:hypothetical protein
MKLLPGLHRAIKNLINHLSLISRSYLPWFMARKTWEILVYHTYVIILITWLPFLGLSLRDRALGITSHS